MSWMEANGVELHYVLDGPKAQKPLVLIHELGGGVCQLGPCNAIDADPSNLALGLAWCRPI